MNEPLTIKHISSFLKLKEEAEIIVIGTSMNPTLYEGDKVIIKKCDKYRVGDILVFYYKNEGFLIHRLLKHDNRYFCKGDNAFRLEDIQYNQIIGKAISVNGKPIRPWETWKQNLSYLVNREFLKHRYNSESLTQTTIFKLYAALILGKEEKRVKYKKTEKMDFIFSDDTTLVVYDPESENTYFFDETGIDILNCLNEACTIDAVLNKLCDIYSATPDTIRPDVEEFVADTVIKGVVELV